jgi:class 3 adenylate cyclase
MVRGVVDGSSPSEGFRFPPTRFTAPKSRDHAGGPESNAAQPRSNNPTVPEDVVIREERKLATVLFADLVGSTALASGEDPERVRFRLERFYDAMADEVESAGGTVEKFAGDAVMAVFGAPAALEDHAERALHAALAMQRRLGDLFRGELALRVGVNTGEVVVGRAREGSSFVSGDAVNVAARLEQSAGAGEILVGERTVSTVRGAFELAEPETMEAKGKPEGITARRLVRALTLQRPRGVSGLDPVFVGREGELAQLQAAYRRVIERRRPLLVTIVGDAGVGKTRLVRELWQWLAVEEPQPLQRTGRCLPYGQIAFWPFGEILKEQLGILDGDSPQSVLARLGDGEILGLALGLDVAGNLHPLTARERFQDAWVSLFEELTTTRPAAVLVEDLHWAEGPLLDLLEHLLEYVHAPLLMLGTARPELLDSRPGFGGLRGQTLVLEPLKSEASMELLSRLLGTDPPNLLRDVVAEAEGNPFFMEEVLGSLIDRGLLEHQNGGWAMKQLPSGFLVPDTVQAVVAARIDLLAPAEKEALQAASVIGRIFWSGPVYELCPGTEPNLRLLEERDFIRLRLGSSIEGEREYTIKHAVTREVAYTSIPRARRARLHAAFASWIKRLGGGRDEHAPLLAHHYTEACRPDDADLAWAGAEGDLEELRLRAVAWLRRAAELAVGRYEIDEGIEHLTRALQLETNDLGRAELWRRIGRANTLKYDGEAFWTAMLNSLEECSDRAESAQTYSELAFHTATRSAMWQRRPDPELVRGWIERALALSDPNSFARARALIARSWYDPAVFADAAREASSVAERLGDLELRSWALAARSRSALKTGGYRDAADLSSSRLELVRKVGDPDHVAFIYFYALDPAIAMGRLDEARRIAAAHDDVTGNLTVHHRLHGVACLLVVENAAGCWERIRNLRTAAERAVAANVATPCFYNPWSLLACALAEEILECPDEARRLEQDAEALGMEGYDFLLDPLRIHLALARGDLDDVERRIPKEAPPANARDVDILVARMDALAALRWRDQLEAEAPALLNPGTYLEPFVLRGLGIARPDPELVEQAQQRFREMGLHWHAAETAALAEGAR